MWKTIICNSIKITFNTNNILEKKTYCFKYLVLSTNVCTYSSVRFASDSQAESLHGYISTLYLTTEKFLSMSGQLPSF